MHRIAAMIVFLLVVSVILLDVSQKESPINITRDGTIWQWCPCGQGVKNVTVWPKNNEKRSFGVEVGSQLWIKFQGQVNRIAWRCDGGKEYSSYVGLREDQWLSIVIFTQNRTYNIHRCGKQTGKISFNTWNKTDYISTIPFTSHTEGYACFKIPTLLKTHKGTLIIFSEARSPGCDDFDRTDLVYKRSFDNGQTWSSLKKLIEIDGEQGQCGHKLVIGNISPVQLRENSKKHPGRIVAPYTHNNFKLWMVYSDDDGQSWHGNHELPNVSQTLQHPDCSRNMSYFGFNIDEVKIRNSPDFLRYLLFLCRARNPFDNPKWTSKLKAPYEWTGVGPSRGIQLKSGRILIPGHKSPIRGLSQVPGALPISQLYNNFAKGFVLISDDDGQTWRQGEEWPTGQGGNQHQLIQIDDGTVISNSRAMSIGSPQFRLQSMSFTQGNTFTKSQFTTIPSPFAGCQGSTVGGERGKVYVTAPDPSRGRSVLQYLVDGLGCHLNLNGREKLSLWSSRDNGKTYKLEQMIDPGLSAQTSLQYQNNRLYLLYEQADPLPKTTNNRLMKMLIQNLRVLLPTRFVYRQLELNKQI